MNETICQKIPYDSKTQAKKILKGFKKNYFKGKARFYRCQKCNKWHVTTMPKSKARILTRTLRKLGITSGQVYENEYGQTIEIIEPPRTLEGIGLFLRDFRLLSDENKNKAEDNYNKNIRLIYEMDIIEANAIAAGTNMSKEELDEKYAKYRNKHDRYD